MSIITVNCPTCKKPYRVYNHPDTRIECLACKHYLSVPNNTGNENYVVGIITTTPSLTSFSNSNTPSQPPKNQYSTWYTVLICTVCIVLAGCLIASLSSSGIVHNWLSKRDKAHLELSGSSPYRLEITEFEWTYGTIERDRFNGDFETLDHKTFDLLKGKGGVCEVYLEVKSNDKYGQTNKAFNNIGNIDLTELNRFQSWEYWSKDSGIRHLIYKHDVQQDGTITTALPTIPNVQSNTDSAVKMQEDTLNK